MKYILILSIACSACDSAGPEQLDWQKALVLHTCTDEQMVKATNESSWCSDNTTYLSTYCYGAAIIRNCTPMDEVRVNAGD